MLRQNLEIYDNICYNIHAHASIKYDIWLFERPEK